MRIDGKFWDPIFTVMNLDLTLSLIAVHKDTPYRLFLDDQQALCPERRTKSGGKMCECHFEAFTQTMVDHTCGIAGLMGRAGVEAANVLAR